MKKAIQYSLLVTLGLAVVGCSKEESSTGSSGGRRNGLASVLGLGVGGSSKELHDNKGTGRTKVQLWKDGPYWAETNIGAKKPWESGYNFWWGDTVGYRWRGDTIGLRRDGNGWVASDGSSSNFSFNQNNTPTDNKSFDTLKSEGWITAAGVLAPEHDAAHVQWGGRWRIPTKREWDDLLNNCDWEWTTMNDVNGYLVKGRDAYASANIFLPCYVGGDTRFDLNDDGPYGISGEYWSSVLRCSGGAWHLCFESDSRFTGSISCGWGNFVRPLQSTKDETTSESARTKTESKKSAQKGTSPSDNRHTKVQLWKDGPYWAETNIGAEKPWESGCYFWWGGATGYRYEGNIWVSTSDGWGLSPCARRATCKYIDTLKREGLVDENGILAPEHDAAHVHWGGKWRIPTKQEWDDLLSKCDWKRTQMNGVKGYAVRGRGAYASASIFLPCVGYCSGTSLSDAGSEGYYWSSVPYSVDDYGAWYLYFNRLARNHGTRGCDRDYLMSVRPVQGFSK